ncbi:hypothetical protein [Desulfocurvus sp.]|jgi:hypothetical protein|uniref:hypothetical protein n=1 Tax=Desulfocurvus sp. TaxID=2871698 RepID=UPI0025C6F070|nr:hypothetical protein [Desulfocurvus sp.]MCK9241341.1 hypothetical protein [Desulfocurvus sp.]
MRLILTFLLLSVLAAYSIETWNRPRARAAAPQWSGRVYERLESRNTPLYYPWEER